MEIYKPILPPAIRTPIWRYAALVVLIVGSLLWILSLDPIAQNTAYHSFADTRELFGIPNFFDVITNLPFLIVGLVGVWFCLRAQVGAIRRAWIVLFFGVGLVSVGSAYYHWNPNNGTLVWDRLPMTIGFMGLFVALLGEYLGNRIAVLLLFPAVALGLATVVYWHFTDDLRPYLWVQLAPLLTIPAVMILFRSGYSHQWLLIVALGWYVLAKVTEAYDVAIFLNTQELLSGHSIKHLLAAAGSYSILVMLQRRKHLE
ncbi:Expressed protein precursor [Olavius algarvensis associated proteobacterium Delta 3]|nr:Expressed protein precursor [Olavius algarvensis associated proteobacterium Delta 3]CAB5132539.1 Expressed protein precursor [Olavius algarvensis associated proteobacterium Delta 3]